MSAKAYFTLQSDAQAYADKIHGWLVANNPEYAKSVAAGQTTAWDVPRQDVDGAGKPISDWYVVVEPRCADALTATEKSRLEPVPVRTADPDPKA